MKVLITGGGGFIGSHLVDSQLAQRHDVRTIDLNTADLSHAAANPHLEVLEGDLTDNALVRRLVDGIDIIYHLASAHLDVTLPESHYRQVNVDATMSLLQAARDAGVARMIHCSTNSVLGDIKNPPVDEAAVPHPTNIYEQTKLEGERAALQFHKDAGFPVVVIRPAWVYGPRCPRTSRLMRMISKGRFVMFGDGQTLRHPIYIDDMIAALELSAVAEQAVGETFFIAGEEAVTIEKLVYSIAEVEEVQLRVIHLPLSLGKAAGTILQSAFTPLGKQPPFSRRSLDFYIKDNEYDISKARHELGFEPLTSLRAGLEQTWAAMQAQQLTLKGQKMDATMSNSVQAVHDYWNTHTLGFQYVTDTSIDPYSPEFFAHIRPWMNPYKFPWIMERIERESALLQGKHLLEIGCGMGYDSLEFLKRGVKVTATDLTPNAVKMTLRHFEIAGVEAEAVHTANALALPYDDNTFDAVWANGVLHATGDTERAISEARRVLKPGGRAIISHFYRKPSWMYALNRLGRENIEYKEEDPPINEFYTEEEILDMFKGYEIVEAVQEHYRALPVRRDGLKANLYKYGFRPAYNMIPESVAKQFAYKLSVTAIKV